MVFLKLRGAAQQPTLKCRGGALFGSTRELCLRVHGGGADRAGALRCRARLYKSHHMTYSLQLLTAKPKTF